MFFLDRNGNPPQEWYEEDEHTRITQEEEFFEEEVDESDFEG